MIGVWWVFHYLPLRRRSRVPLTLLGPRGTGARWQALVGKAQRPNPV